jgi:hypothetical protein
MESISRLAEPAEAWRSYDLTAGEALYKLLTNNGYKVLRHRWPDFWVVPPDGGRGFGVEVKSVSSQVRPGQKEMHAALEAAGVKVVVLASLVSTGR